MPQKNKPRFYIALCSEGEPAFGNEVDWDEYDCALLVGAFFFFQAEDGIRDHVRHYRGTPKMFYEEQDMDLSLAQMIHVKIAVAKVISVTQLQKNLRNVPLHDDDPTWTCLSWVKCAFQELVANRKVLKGYVSGNDWPEIEARTRRYVHEKREQRRILDHAGTLHTIPTWNFWENRETNR